MNDTLELGPRSMMGLAMASEMLYKALDPGGRCRNGGTGSWSLPRDGKPGEWMPRVTPRLCRSGYHMCTAVQLLDWLGPEIWVVEVGGAAQYGDEKSCHETARIIAPTYWDERLARHFAADCAERVLPLFEAERPDDDRARKAIQAARDFADGQIGDAARAAARDAAWTAARDAVRAAARDAAWDAAGDARDAARAAARDAAGDAARDAAGAAAGAAARAAVRAAAWDAWAAAGATAWTAWAAAWDVERQWQTRRLRWYLHGAPWLGIRPEPVIDWPTHQKRDRRERVSKTPKDEE